MVLLLIRHALTAWTGHRLAGWHPGISLSEEGRRQAERLAERVDALAITAVYSSPLERCIETAGPFARAKRLRIRRTPALGEIRCGTWEGKPLKVVARTKLWRMVQAQPSRFTFPGGEAMRDCQARVVDALEKIAASHSGETVAAVTHAEPIRLALAHYAGVHLDLFQRLVISPASVSAVSLGPGGPAILAMNDTGGLTLPARRTR